MQKGALFKPTGMMMTPGLNVLHRMMPCSNELLYLSVLFITINKDPVLLSSPYSPCDFFSLPINIPVHVPAFVYT